MIPIFIRPRDLSEKEHFFPETKQITQRTIYTNDKLTTISGSSQSWWDDGSKEYEGQYHNGKRHGTWKFFNQSYSNSNELYTEGVYENDLKIGTWTTFDSLGNIASEHTYVNGKKEGAYRIFKDKVIAEERIYKADTLFSSTPPRIDSSAYYKIVERMPRFYNLNCENLDKTDSVKKQCADTAFLRYIYKNIQYPRKARENNVQGTALIRFVVTKEGKIEDVECIRGLCEPIKTECLQVVNTLGKWILGMQRDKNVPVYFNLPIKFRLE